MRRYLVVANQTLGGDQLRAEIKRRLAAGPCRFHVVVPATGADDLINYGIVAGLPVAPVVVVPPGDRSPAEEGRRQAEQRLADALACLRGHDVDATGEVGDPDPCRAVGAVLAAEPVDEVIVSTLPAGLSRWLKLDLPSRLERRFGLPVTHVVPGQD